MLAPATGERATRTLGKAVLRGVAPLRQRYPRPFPERHAGPVILVINGLVYVVDADADPAHQERLRPRRRPGLA
eukprot:8822262-Lingulodinium_polyedra.AAC.1